MTHLLMLLATKKKKKKKKLTKSNNLMEKPVEPSPTETESGPQGQTEVRVDDAEATKLPVGGFTKKRQQRG